MESQRVPDGFRHLPRVPRTGRATEVLPQILLNTRPETLRKANSKRKPGSGPIGSKGHAKRSSRVGTQTRGRSSSVVGKALNFGRFLVQEDRLAKLQFSESVLAPGGDSGQHDVGLALKALEEKSLESSEKDVLASLASFWEDSSMLDPLDPLTSVSNRERDGSAPMELSSCDGLCGRSWAAQQAYCRSLMSSRNDSRTGAAQVSRDETTPELHPELRRQDLQRSFSIFPEEVVARLKDFRRRPVGDYHIDAPDAKADDSGSDGPMSSNSNVSFLEDLIPVAPKRRSSKTSRISEDSDSTATGAPQRKVLRAVPESLEELRELIQGAQLTMIPLKVPPQPELMTLNADIELIEPDISSPREELLRGIKVLNIFRWFCRLPPVQLEEDEAEVCDFLSNALMLRQPVFLSESHLISRRIFELGHQLGGFLAKGDSTVMLHKESSLVSAISVGILCSHTVGWSYASTPAPEQRHAVRSPAHQRLKEETMQRAARHRDRQLLEAPKEGVSKGGFAMLLSLAQAKEPVTLQNLPEPLAGYRTLWEISDRWTADKEPKVEKRPEAPPRPRTNGSSRSRPGTVGTMGTAASNGSKEDRPNTSSSRVRQVVWGSTESAKRREWGRACNLSWGDRSRSLILRRQLLNSKLRSIGGSRVNDTCVLRAPPSADASKEDEPDFVVFPPEGVCPMELLVGCHLPTWTIMPDSQQFQPSHSLQVRMWRVRLLRREDAAEETAVEATERRRSRGSSCTLPEEPPYDAIRLEELPLSFFTCDCAAEGNSFCIIFRPQLSRISEGDQLEVELLGLRGSSQRHHFFHEFRSCGELAWQDHEFFEEVQNFCKMFSDIDVFKGSFPLPTVSRSFSLPSDTALPELKPISHLSKDFKTDEVELSMYFYCAGVAAFEADLYLQRSDGKIRVDRSTLVFNLDDHFLVRVKLPCSVSKYELAFRLSTMQRPRKLLEHPLKYSIRSLESRSFPLNGVEDPPSQKYQRYGFCPVPPTAQLLGMTILAPMEYGLLPGSLYFLVHIQPACLPMEVPPEPVGETRPSQLFERLRCDHDEAEERALEMQLIKQKDPLFSAETGDHSTRMDEMLRRRSFQNTQRMMLHRPSVAAMDPTVNVMRRLHHGLELHLAERTQDLPQMMHLDLVVRESRSNQQRFALRLQRKLDHPEFYEGVLHLADHDPGAKVELYYRITEETYRAPLKVAEWRVGRLNEAYDD